MKIITRINFFFALFSNSADCVYVVLVSVFRGQNNFAKCIGIVVCCWYKMVFFHSWLWLVRTSKDIAIFTTENKFMHCNSNHVVSYLIYADATIHQTHRLYQYLWNNIRTQNMYTQYHLNIHIHTYSITILHNSNKINWNFVRHTHTHTRYGITTMNKTHKCCICGLDCK